MTAWKPDEAKVLGATPAGLAAQLAVMASELPGFENGDRAHLRRVAFALGEPQADQAEALRLARDAFGRRCAGPAQASRPEAVLLTAVLWLLATGAAPGDAGTDGPA